MKVLGISGKALHGKDTCASLIRELALEEYGKTIVPWSFGHAVKAAVFAEARGAWSFDDVWHTKPPQIRERLQKRGTEEGRHVHGENVWLLHAEAYLELFDKYFPVAGIVIPDVRFPNEVAFIRAGGRVQRPQIYKEGRSHGEGIALYISSNRPTLTGEAAKHSSETSLNDLNKEESFDGIIVNNIDTTFGDLKDQLRPYVQQLLT